jgi:hypothetical protein
MADGNETGGVLEQDEEWLWCDDRWSSRSRQKAVRNAPIDKSEKNHEVEVERERERFLFWVDRKKMETRLKRRIKVTNDECN